MNQIDRKALSREYKESPPPVGVYRVRNTVSGRSLVGSAVNLAGRLNRHRFQLEMGSHPNRDLLADWKEFGAAAFAFEELDRLKPPDEPGYDPAEDLQVLEEMWIDKLTAAGEPLY